MDITFLPIIEPFIIFFVCTIASVFIIVFIPAFFGKKMLPTVTASKKEKVNMSSERLYNLLTNYLDYPKWKRSIKKTKQTINEQGQTVWTEFYKLSRIKNTFTETRAEKNSLLVYTTKSKEYMSVYSFQIDEYDSESSILNIKETIYFIEPYLRFFYGFVFVKKKFVNSIFRLIKKHNKKL